jgi:hypothetical protein
MDSRDCLTDFLCTPRKTRGMDLSRMTRQEIQALLLLLAEMEHE